MILPDQPPPIPATGDLWAELIAETARHPTLVALLPEMAERRALGIERYGVPLQRGNGRDPLVDARQEILDCAAYLWQANLPALALEALGLRSRMP